MRVDRWLARRLSVGSACSSLSVGVACSLRLEWLARRGWSGLLVVGSWTGLLVADVDRVVGDGCRRGVPTDGLDLQLDSLGSKFLAFKRIPSERLRRDLERIGGWTITTKMKRDAEQTSETFRIVLSPF